MRLVLISDTHCQLDKVNVPDGDLLIHSGDATYIGDTHQIFQFNEHLGKIKDKYKHGVLFIPGNHDWMFQRNETLARQLMSNAKVLIDETIVIEGLKIYGTPWQPFFHNWAFNLHRGQALKEKWDLIPNDTNILISHGPPYGILDRCPNGKLAGCADLYKRIFELKDLKLHVFGHIHDMYGTKQIQNITFVNASICTERYKPNNAPIVIDIN